MQLRDTRVDGILCSGHKVEQLASLTTHPLLRQRLQKARWLTQGAPHQAHTLTEWINAAIHTTWVKVGELPAIVSKWYTYAELAQVVRELGMKQSMFN